MDTHGKHLLIIRMSALGDVAMTIPIIYSLARQRPDLKITVLTREFFSRLLISRPTNVHIAIADTKGRHAGITGTLRLASFAKSLKPDMVADFHDVLRSRVIDMAMTASGIPVSVVDKGRRDRRKLTRQNKSEITHQTNYIDRYVNVLERLGLNTGLDFTGLFAVNKQPRTIGIAPFARYSTKTYPPELMEQVAAHLAGQGFKVYLFGSKGDEARILQDWEEKYPGCEAMPGKLSLEDELRLMSTLQVMVTMDSANMHLASLAGTKVVSVWGSTTPHCGFLGYRQDETLAVSLGLPCQPCSIAGKPQCPLGHFNCMRLIKPEQIIDKVTQAISSLDRDVTPTDK